MARASSTNPSSAEEPAGVPRESLGGLFLRFLKFGALAWGGPVAQIAMIRQELVEEERWISRDHFNRILGVYQVLPGPEAHELCVYFGMLARGRIGGFLAGLGFMLPGFILMLALSALYAGGLTSTRFQAFFLGAQPAVVALVIRAVHRIGSHAVTNRWLWSVALAAAAGQLSGVPFWMTLTLAGAAYLLATKRRPGLAAATLLILLILIGLGWAGDGLFVQRSVPAPTEAAGDQTHASLPRLLVAGLRAGLLTFGGAYTVLPFLQRDAVLIGGWMTNAQFLDGVALSGILPAPFIIFATFVGYIGGGALGALALTIGVFLPAFAFTLLAHQPLERATRHPASRAFLDGVTAGVVGLIAATSLVLLAASVRSPLAIVIFLAALAALYAWKAKAAVAGVILSAGALGLLIFR